MIWRIYRYYNPIEDKSYVGQTTKSVDDRARNGKGYYEGSPFREAIDKYGWETFEQSILRLCTSQEEADYYERFFIEKYNTIFPNGYNLESGGRRGCSLHTLTLERMTNSHKESIKGEEWKQNHSKAIKESMTTEVRQKIAERTREAMNRPEVRQKLSEHTREAMSNPDVRQKCSETKIGRHWFNNGIKNVFTYECPDGFIPGMLIKSQCN